MYPLYVRGRPSQPAWCTRQSTCSQQPRCVRCVRALVSVRGGPPRAGERARRGRARFGPRAGAGRGIDRSLDPPRAAGVATREPRQPDIDRDCGRTTRQCGQRHAKCTERPSPRGADGQTSVETRARKTETSPTVKLQMNHQTVCGPLLLLLLVAADGANGAQQVHVKDGELVGSGSRFVGRYTSQLNANVLGKLFDPVTPSDWENVSMINASVLRYLVLDGDYLADVPLRLPSLLVLQLTKSATIKPAANLSLENTTRFTGLVEMHDVSSREKHGSGTA